MSNNEQWKIIMKLNILHTLCHRHTQNINKCYQPIHIFQNSLESIMSVRVDKKNLSRGSPFGITRLAWGDDKQWSEGRIFLFHPKQIMRFYFLLIIEPRHETSIMETSAVSSLTLRICAGWSEALLVAHTTLLEISCRGSYALGG